MRFNILACALLTALTGMTPLTAQQLGAPRMSPRTVQGSASFGKLPMTFEANKGQTAGQVKFLSRGKGYTAFLTTGGMVLSLRPAQVVANSMHGNTSAAQPPATTLQFQLSGANKNPVAVGEEQQAGRVNYFLGNNSAQWHTNVPTYAKVRFKNVYPGIDLIYYGNHQQLEYDFAVAPGVDPAHIQFEIKGADQTQVDAQGNLVLKIGSSELHFQTPIVYQESNGQRVPVEGGYVIKNSNSIGFRVGQYDANKPLVIDPVLVYSTYLGGSGSDQLTGIAVDNSGSVYVAGYTDSATFPLTTLGSLPAGTDHVFVAKLDATGSNLIYADYIGGNNQDYAAALVLDSANNVYVTGSTESSNFPAVAAYQSQQPGPYSGFVTKISADGSSVLYSTYLGGNSFDQPSSIAIDSLGQVHVAGFTMSQNFPVVNANQSAALANQASLTGDYGFLTKFSTNGSSLVYSTYLGGNSNVAQDCGSPCWPAPYSAVSALAVDANGNAYVTGMTNTYNFPVTSGAYLATNTTQQDVTVGFVTKFTSAGSLGYSTYFYGSSGNPVGIAGIAVDGSGSAYITGGVTSDGNFPVTSTSICDPSVSGFGCSYAFVTKFDPTGASVLYSTFLGANNYATPQAIAVDASDNAYVLASTRSSSYVTNNAIEAYSSSSDILLVKIDAGASTELFSTYLGGSGNDVPAGMAVDSNGNVYVAGSTDSTDFPTTPGAFQSSLGGRTDAFIAKISAASAPAVSFAAGSLQFSALQVGSTSQAQTVLLRNMGSAALAISSITASGDFAETDNCGTSVPAAGSCTFSVTFAPTASGSRAGAITIQDNAAGSTHQITLNGIGTAASVSLTSTSLTFSSMAVGNSSAAQTVTLTNNGNAALSMGSIQATGDFAQTNNCPGTLASGSSCAVRVTFTPTTTGSRTGTVTVSDSAPGGQQTITLTGTGSDFAVTTTTSSNTIQAGATATYTLSVASVGGTFSNAVSLACSGLPAGAACSFSPSSPTPGASNVPVTMTITTIVTSADATPSVPARKSPVYAAFMQLQGFGLFGLVLAGSKKRSKRLAIFMILALLVLGMMCMSGCAGGTGIGQPKNNSTTYTVTVTGTSGSIQHSVPVTLILQ